MRLSDIFWHGGYSFTNENDKPATSVKFERCSLRIDLGGFKATEFFGTVIYSFHDDLLYLYKCNIIGSLPNAVLKLAAMGHQIITRFEPEQITKIVYKLKEL